MSSCFQTLSDYGLRSIGYGERLLPKADITLCEQFVLIGSGMIWNIYFAVLALLLGFFFATVLALGKNSNLSLFSAPCRLFIFIFRGSPLFIQFFFAYDLFVLLPRLGFDIDLGFLVVTVETRWLTKAWLGALIVLFLNTSAYAGEIFYGALRAVPSQDLESADAFGFTGIKNSDVLYGQQCSAWHGPLTQMRQFLCSMQQHWCFLLVFQRGNKKEMRFIMPVISLIKPLILLFLIQLLAFTLFC